MPPPNHFAGFFNLALRPRYVVGHFDAVAYPLASAVAPVHFRQLSHEVLVFEAG
ncbi:MAG: hypothetical protein IPM98_13540 [Lewinellaceae bacterium]|nr:hypothetical protein [Lewinellaceae bacterium]